MYNKETKEVLPFRNWNYWLLAQAFARKVIHRAAYEDILSETRMIEKGGNANLIAVLRHGWLKNGRYYTLRCP